LQPFTSVFFDGLESLVLSGSFASWSVVNMVCSLLRLITWELRCWIHPPFVHERAKRAYSTAQTF